MSSKQPDGTDRGATAPSGADSHGDRRAGSSARGQNASAKPREDNTQGKLFAPASPVDVPNMPPAAKTDAAAEMETLQETAVPKTEREVNDANSSDGDRPAKIDTTEANWADSTQPAPDKRTARSSII